MHIVTKEKELTPLLELIDEHKLVCLDLEFVPERTFFPVLCLVQCCVNGEAFVIDPFEVEDLSPLWERVMDQSVKSIFHAASQDLNLIYLASGLYPKNIFDTQIAAGFAGYGYSAGYRRLLDEVLGVHIPKTESFSDWQARPLTKSQLEYAVNDVIHLEPLANSIEAELKKLDRLSWAQEECLYYENETLYSPDRSRDFLKVKGSNKLNNRGLAILRELWKFRDKEARERNKPPKTILQDYTLAEVAKRKVSSLEELKKLRGIRQDQVHKYGSGLVSAVKKGLSIPDNECPSIPSGKAPHRSEVIVSDFVYLLLKNFADHLNLAIEHLATRDEILALVRCKPEKLNQSQEKIRLTGGWRKEVIGDKILDILKGANVEFQISNNANAPRALKINIESN